MKITRAHNTTKDLPLAATVRHATSIWARFWGLMGKRPLSEGEALLIDPCTSVHTFFMRFPIDVVYLSADDTVLKIVPAMPAWRASLGGKGAKKVLEMLPNAAAAANLEPGDHLIFDPS
jgi:uncharacterized membrane protein (UPF0127 family)